MAKVKTTNLRFVKAFGKAINPGADTTMFLENICSLNDEVDALGDEHQIVKLISMRVYVKTGSPGQHWICPVLIQSNAAPSDTVDIAESSWTTAINTAIVGNYGCSWLGHPRISKDVPIDDPTATSGQTEGTMFSTELPQSILRYLEKYSNYQRDDDVEVYLCMIGYVVSQAVNLDQYVYLEIDYQLKPRATAGISVN
jgi:hypothetical protein